MIVELKVAYNSDHPGGQVKKDNGRIPKNIGQVPGAGVGINQSGLEF